MLRKVMVALYILICFILQSTLLQEISFAGIVPNLLIIITATFGFMRGEHEGIIIGLICGLLSDIFFGDMLGFYALILMYIGFINGKFNRVFYPEDIKLPIALIVTSDLTYGIVCYILTFMLRGKFQFGYYFLHIILPEMLYTTIATIVIYPIALRINRLLEAQERKRAHKFV